MRAEAGRDGRALVGVQAGAVGVQEDAIAARGALIAVQSSDVWPVARVARRVVDF